MTVSQPVDGLRERKKQKTRDALIRSALEQFADRGFDEVTVEQICARCEVSPRTFFRYFATKEDVLFTQTLDEQSIMLQVLDEQPAELSPLDQLAAAFGELAVRYQEQRREYLIRRRIHSTPSLATGIAEHRRVWENALVEHLRATPRGSTASDFDLRLTVAVAITAFRLAVECWVSSDGPERLPTFVVRAIDGVRHLNDLGLSATDR